MSDPTPVADAVLHIAREELGFHDVPPQDADLAEHLDSVQRLSLVVAIEDHFDIAFEPEDDAGIRTLADAIAVIEQRLAAAPDA